MSIGCVVIAPALVPRKPGDRIKTDRRDAVKLVRMYRAGELTPVWVPTEDQEAVRDVLRARDDARRDRTSARHRLSKFLLRHGQRFSEGRGWTHKFWRWVRELRFGRPTEQIVFEQYIEHVQQLDARIKLFDAEIAKLAELVSLRFLETHRHVCILGPVGVGKTFLASALGHIACRHGYHVKFARADETLKRLRQSRFVAVKRE